MSPTELIYSVHKFRRAAEREERRLQELLDADQRPPTADNSDFVPTWVHGVRVDKAGPFQHAVILTANKGH